MQLIWFVSDQISCKSCKALTWFLFSKHTTCLFDLMSSSQKRNYCFILPPISPLSGKCSFPFQSLSWPAIVCLLVESSILLPRLILRSSYDPVWNILLTCLQTSEIWIQPFSVTSSYNMPFIIRTAESWELQGLSLLWLVQRLGRVTSADLSVQSATGENVHRKPITAPHSENAQPSKSISCLCRFVGAGTKC